MKITYFKAEIIGEDDCYSIRAKRKKEVQRLVAESDFEYDPIEKVTIIYKNAFDLVDILTSEGRSNY